MMLRIVHTGRAYEVWDILPVTYCKRLPDDHGALCELRAKYAVLRLHYRQQNGVLGKTCREVWRLKELLAQREAEYDQLEEAFDAGWWPERLRARKAEAEIEQLRRSLHDERVRRDEWKKMYHQAVMPELESCQKSTPTIHETQDPR